MWNNAASQRLGFNSSRPPFADASITYVGITRLSVTAFGGTNILSNHGETTDRVGGGLVWQRGPHLFQGEVGLSRDYSTPNASGGAVGTAPIGGYFMYGYRISKRVQAVIRYDNFDEGEERFGGNGIETTETGFQFPHAEHKLREYTLGINYFVDESQKLQLNLIREDPEINGTAFWGPQRTLLMAAYQIGYLAPTRPDSLRGANDRLPDELQPTSNAVFLGANFAPTLGFAAGIDIGLPNIRIVPTLLTRVSVGLLGDANAPSIFGFHGTAYVAAVDQITRKFRISGSRLSLYAGFGAGAYFDGAIYPGARVLFGTNVSRNVGMELITNITGVGRPYVSLETRIPL